MRKGELECVHGVGHSAGIHGCDGCCGAMLRTAMAQAWSQGYGSGLDEAAINPYQEGEQS